jgi:hypothetical protein
MNDAKSATIDCPVCARQPGENNHPRGMIFVGWSLGWRRCTNCGGTGTIREPSVVVAARTCALSDVREWMYAEQTALRAVAPLTETEAADAVARAMLDTAVVRLRALGLSSDDIAQLAAESYSRRAGTAGIIR